MKGSHAKAPLPTPAPTAGPCIDVTGQPEVPTAALPDPGPASNWPRTVMEKIDKETDRPGQIEKYLGLVGDAVAPSTMFAELTVSPAMNASIVIEAFAGSNLIGPGVALVDVADAIRQVDKRVQDGDLSSIKSMLVAQAHALGVLFTSFAIKAQAQASQRNIESFMGLALRAQAQGVATIGALALVDLRRAPAGEGRAQPSPPAASEQDPFAVPPQVADKAVTIPSGQSAGSVPATRGRSVPALAPRKATAGRARRSGRQPAP